MEKRLFYGIIQAITPYPEFGCVGVTLRQKIWDTTKKQYFEKDLTAWYYAKAAEYLAKKDYLIGATVILTAHEEHGNLYGDDSPVTWGMLSVPADLKEHTAEDEQAFKEAVQGLVRFGLRPPEWTLTTNDPERIEAVLISLPGKTEAEKAFRAAAQKIIRQARYTFIGPVGSVKEFSGNVKVSVAFNRSKDDTVWNDVIFWGEDNRVSAAGETALRLNPGEIVLLYNMVRNSDFNGRRQFRSTNRPKLLRASLKDA